MKRLLMMNLLAWLVVAFSGCKTTPVESDVLGIAEVDRTETLDDGQVAVWCKEGKSHNQMCKFTMTQVIGYHGIMSKKVPLALP